MGKKGDGESSTAGREAPPQASGRLTLTLQKIVITVKKDLIVTFILDGIEKVSNVDKSLFEELNDVS